MAASIHAAPHNEASHSATHTRIPPPMLLLLLLPHPRHPACTHLVNPTRAPLAPSSSSPPSHPQDTARAHHSCHTAVQRLTYAHPLNTVRNSALPLAIHRTPPPPRPFPPLLHSLPPLTRRRMWPALARPRAPCRPPCGPRSLPCSKRAHQCCSPACILLAPDVQVAVEKVTAPAPGACEAGAACRRAARDRRVTKQQNRA